jgi:hypothetical protein
MAALRFNNIQTIKERLAAWQIPKPLVYGIILRRWKKKAFMLCQVYGDEVYYSKQHSTVILI